MYAAHRSLAAKYPPIIALAAIASIAPALAQSQDRSVAADVPTEVTFSVAYAGISPPVEVAAVMVNGKEMPLNAPISVNGMWLRTVGIVIRNISSKPIVAGSVDLVYTETGNGSQSSPVLDSSLGLGHPTPHWFIRKDGSKRPETREPGEAELRLIPGQRAVFTFKGTNHENADQDQIRAFQMAGKLTRITISLDKFIFEDESAWMAGNYYLPVPPPMVWKKVTPAEFSATPAAQ